MMGRFMELFRSNARPTRKDVVAGDFERLRRDNYERDDRERRAGVDFMRLARRGRSRTQGGHTMAFGPAPAKPERRG